MNLAIDFSREPQGSNNTSLKLHIYHTWARPDSPENIAGARWTLFAPTSYILGEDVQVEGIYSFTRDGGSTFTYKNHTTDRGVEQLARHLGDVDGWLEDCIEQHVQPVAIRLECRPDILQAIRNVDNPKPFENVERTLRSLVALYPTTNMVVSHLEEIERATK